MMVEEEEPHPILDIGLLLEEPIPQYSSHACYRFFSNMICRSRRRRIECDFTLGRPEFAKWIDIMGPIPKGIKKPSIGRHDHEKGYVFDTNNNRWNFRWQEHSENCREGGRKTAQSGKLKIAQRASSQ